MHILFKTLIYYLIGSVIAGFVMGAGFATNLGGRASRQQLAELQRLGTYTPLDIEGIEGGLISRPNERRPTIVYVHGRSANRTELKPLAEALFREGYNAVLWDGKSRQISYGPKEVEQVQKIILAIRNHPGVEPAEIYIIGSSLGAAIAIGAAASDTQGYIRAIVADSPYANLKNVASRYVTAFGIVPEPLIWPARTVTFAVAEAMHGIDFERGNPADWAPAIACPVFLIHGMSDRTIPHTHSERIMEKIGTQKHLWLVEGAGHTKSFARNPAEYVRRVLQFLEASRTRGKNQS